MSILSTREWATLIWGCIFMLYVLCHREIRKSLWNVIVIFSDKKLRILWEIILLYVLTITMVFCYLPICNGVQREHNKKLNNGLPILHKVPPKRDYGRYFCIMAEKGGTSHGGLTEKLSLFFHAKKQEVNAYGR